MCELRNLLKDINHCEPYRVLSSLDLFELARALIPSEENILVALSQRVLTSGQLSSGAERKDNAAIIAPGFRPISHPRPRLAYLIPDVRRNPGPSPLYFFFVSSLYR